MKKHGIIVLIALCLGLLSACSCGSGVPNYVENPKLTGLTSYQQNLLIQIESSCIKVLKQGMVFTFFIPTDMFFAKDTRELKYYRRADIFNLAKFLDSYRHYFAHPHIFVDGFTSTVWFYPARKKLSMHYAESIALQLNMGGIPRDIMTVRGFGAKNKIASNKYAGAAKYNRRVVVVIR